MQSLIKKYGLTITLNQIDQLLTDADADGMLAVPLDGLIDPSDEDYPTLGDGIAEYIGREVFAKNLTTYDLIQSCIRREVEAPTSGVPDFAYMQRWQQVLTDACRIADYIQAMMEEADSQMGDSTP